MRIYTKRGDSGQTDLLGGQRVGKDHLRVAAYGEVDEVNACLGLALATCQRDEVSAPLITIQHRLFDLGADLATPGSDNADADAVSADRVGAEQVRDLEIFIDQAQAKLPALKQFILPGGTLCAAHLHHARVVCRRAERLLVALGRVEPVCPEAIAFLNRLSDLLFVFARLANHLEGEPDVPWLPMQDGSTS